MVILSGSKLVEIFVKVDDFMKKNEITINEHLIGHQKWQKKMSKSEIISIIIFFHLSRFRCFSSYYKNVILGVLKDWFPTAYPYEKFIHLQSSVMLEMFFFLNKNCLGETTTANYIDSKPLKVCHIKREKSHRVFDGIAQKGKSSIGYFFGFKLHVICNEIGEIVRFKLTPGNIADNNHDILQHLFQQLKGMFLGDKGYITTLKKVFKEQGIHLITKVKKNMKPVYLTHEEKFYLKKRGLIESVFDFLVNQCQIEHTRHRSPQNFLMNLFSGLAAYHFIDKKPSIFPFKQETLLDNILPHQIVLI